MGRGIIEPDVNAANGAVARRAASPRGHLPRYVGPALAVAGLGVGASRDIWGSPGEPSGPVVVTAVALIYVGLLVSWHAAVGRVSGPPTVWFTAAVPALIAVQAVVVEAINAYWTSFDTSAILMPLVLIAAIVASIGGHVSGRRWRTGLLAWSLALCHIGVCIGALAGIPLGTFGDATRSDELLVWGAVLPLIGMTVALPFAPRTPWLTRLAAPAVAVAALPAYLLSGTLVAGLAALTIVCLAVATIGLAPQTERTVARTVRR